MRGGGVMRDSEKIAIRKEMNNRCWMEETQVFRPGSVPQHHSMLSCISQMKTQVRNVIACSELQGLLDDLL